MLSQRRVGIRHWHSSQHHQLVIRKDSKRTKNLDEHILTRQTMNHSALPPSLPSYQHGLVPQSTHICVFCCWSGIDRSTVNARFLRQKTGLEVFSGSEARTRRPDIISGYLPEPLYTVSFRALHLMAPCCSRPCSHSAQPCFRTTISSPLIDARPTGNCFRCSTDHNMPCDPGRSVENFTHSNREME
jgi:hypothetical protein